MSGSQASAIPNRVKLQQLTVDELRGLARDNSVKQTVNGRTRDRQELIVALDRARLHYHGAAEGRGARARMAAAKKKARGGGRGKF
jgi:hypothetical protein